MRLILLFVLFGFSFSSDREPEKCYRSFQHWYKTNHAQLTQKITKEDLTFEMNYVPNELTIFRELYQNNNYSKKRIKELYALHNVYDEFSLKISTHDSRDLLLSKAADKIEYQNFQFYLIESVQEDFYMIRDLDTISPIHCKFENNYGTAPFITLHLAFEKVTKTQFDKLQIQYSDQLFQSGNVVFDFTLLKNNKIPKIK